MNHILIKRALLGLALGLFAALMVFAFGQMRQEKANDAPFLNVAGIGGAFEMQDQNKNTVTEKALVGKYSILFFGFTYCPIICPTELQKITGVYETLPEKVQKNTQLFFVSLDPKRDSAKVLKDYLSLYNPAWRGLRGTEAQTEAIKRAFKVYSAKIPQDDSYTIDHSTFIYIMGADGQLLRMFRSTDAPQKITEYLKSLPAL